MHKNEMPKVSVKTTKERQAPHLRLLLPMGMWMGGACHWQPLLGMKQEDGRSAAHPGRPPGTLRVRRSAALSRVPSCPAAAYTHSQLVQLWYRAATGPCSCCPATETCSLSARPHLCPRAHVLLQRARQCCGESVPRAREVRL